MNQFYASVRSGVVSPEHMTDFPQIKRTKENCHDIDRMMLSVYRSGLVNHVISTVDCVYFENNAVLVEALGMLNAKKTGCDDAVFDTSYQNHRPTVTTATTIHNVEWMWV